MDIFWQLLDLQSFPSLWYWVFMAVTWIVTIQRPLGVPYGMVEDARYDPQARADVLVLAQMNARRLLMWVDGARVMPVLGFAVLGGIAVLGFHYDFEFGQAVSLIVWPLVWVFWLATRVAARIRHGAEPDAVLRILHWHRYAVLAIACVSMVFSLLWGTVQNILNYPFL